MSLDRSAETPDKNNKISALWQQQQQANEPHN